MEDQRKMNLSHAENLRVQHKAKKAPQRRRLTGLSLFYLHKLKNEKKHVEDLCSSEKANLKRKQKLKKESAKLNELQIKYKNLASADFCRLFLADRKNL